MKIAKIAYIPVIHEGTVDFLSPEKNVDPYLIGEELLDSLSKKNRDDGILSIGRDPRVLNTKHSSIMLSQYGCPVVLSNEEDVKTLLSENYEKIILPDEDITRLFAKVYLSGFSGDIEFARTFLRLDLPKSLTKNPVECRTVNIDSLWVREIAEKCLKESQKSSCWLRQVGSMIFNIEGDINKCLVIAHNHHMPHEYIIYMLGDPRSNLEAGEHIEVTTSCHSEASAIANAARKGIKTEGANMFVTTFPCPTCAMSIAEAGIKRLYFLEGYSSLTALETLKSRGVEIFQVVE
jgi:dCMP deaminase